QAGKVAQFDRFTLAGIDPLQILESDIERHERTAAVLLKTDHLFQRYRLPGSLLGFLSTRVVHEDLPHDAGSDPVEVRAALPVRLRLLDETQIGLIDQGSRLQRMALSFASQVSRSKLAELPVNERHEFSLGSLGAVPPFRQQPRHFMGD